MGNPKHNLLRIVLAALLLFVLVACDDSTRSNPPPVPPGNEDPKDETPTTGSIDLSRAIALGIGQSTSPSGLLAPQSSGPVVVAVNDDGQVETVQQEEITFSDFHIVDGRVFLVPSNTWNYGCALVEVIDDTELECVDPYVYTFYEFQVAPDGTLYYRGSAQDANGNSVDVLRKRTPDGQIFEVFDLTGPLYVSNWAVASDGLLYLSGSTEGVSESWVRRVNEDGSLTTIATGRFVNLLGVWPDGNLYLYDRYNYSLWQIRPDEDTIHAIAYLGGKLGLDEVIHDNDEIGIRLDYLVEHNSSLRIQDGRVMFDYREDDKMEVAELYPTPQLFRPGLEQVRAGVPRGNDYYFAGRLAPDQYAIVKLDTLTGDNETIYETNLEMFTLSVASDGNKAVFSAFEASKNRYVMATVDLATGETTTEPVTTNLTRLEPLN